MTEAEIQEAKGMLEAFQMVSDSIDHGVSLDDVRDSCAKSILLITTVLALAEPDNA